MINITKKETSEGTLFSMSVEKIDLTREEMLERLIEAQYDGMDYKDLYRYFEYYQQREFADWSTEQIESEYKEYFSNEDEQKSERN